MTLSAEIVAVHDAHMAGIILLIGWNRIGLSKK